MARRSRGRSRSRNKIIRSGRDITIIARRTLPPITVLKQLEDRREFNPTRTVSKPQSIRRSDTRLEAKKYTPVFAVNFSNPKGVTICARRKERRQVMFALDIAGKKGVGRGKQRRTNMWSKIGCR